MPGRNLKGQYAQDPSAAMYDGFTIFYNSKGYPEIYIAGQQIKLHVYIWEKANGPKPPKMFVHHKDGDRGNYSLDNLELLTQKEHSRIHAGWVRDDEGHWVAKPCTDCGEVLSLDSFYERKGLAPSAKCKKCHNKRTSTKNMSPERLAKVKAYKKKYYQKVGKLREREAAKNKKTI